MCCAGAGLFIGIELVRDRKTLTPAGEEASWLSNALKERHILLGTDGPHHNVIKIKPPMCVTIKDADFFLTTFADVLAKLPSFAVRSRL